MQTAAGLAENGSPVNASICTNGIAMHTLRSLMAAREGAIGPRHSDSGALAPSSLSSATIAANCSGVRSSCTVFQIRVGLRRS